MNALTTPIVFKTIKMKAEIAAKVSSRTFLLATESCLFAGKLNKTKNFTTLISSICHPFLQEQVSLATMQCISEDTGNVELYWKTSNDALDGNQRYSGEQLVSEPQLG